MTVQDSQCARLYKAEWRIKHPKAKERLETVRDIESWVNEITSSRWWKRYRVPVRHAVITKYTGLRDYGKPTHRYVKVMDGRGRKRAIGYTTGSIAIPRWCRNRLMVLHELAHTIQIEGPDHGRQFVRIYLDLVRRWLGREVFNELHLSFRLNHVQSSLIATGECIIFP